MARWRRHSEGPQPLAASLEQVAGGLRRPDLRGVAAIDEVWADVVGPGLAEHTEPAKLLDGRLSVLVDRAIFGSQLTLRGEEITAALRDRVGVAVTSLEVAVRTR